MKNLINNIRFFFYINFYKIGGGKDMAMCYVTCIVAGVRTYAQVPKFLKAKVKELLIAMDLGELVKED